MKKIWKNLSLASRLYIVMGMMAILITVELIIFSYALDTLSAVRAFVGGEALWSKAQKNALFHLQRFGLTNNEEDYDAFLSYLKVPEGDALAKSELMKKKPNREIIHQGFRQGGIHPDDIDSIIRLLQRFSWQDHIKRAIYQWNEGDRLMVQFKKSGAAYHSLMIASYKDPEAIKAVLQEVLTLNNQLTQVEAEFSYILGEGSRWLEHKIINLLFLLMLLVESIGLSLTFITTRYITKGLETMRYAAENIGNGKFADVPQINSNDEIGKLSESIVKMGATLENSYRDLEKRVNDRTLELSQMLEENKKLYDQTTLALKMRDEYMSVASHEFKTPITALSLQLQIFSKIIQTIPLGPNSEKIKQVSDSTLRQIRRLSKLSEDLLDLTRIRLGKIDITLEEVDVVKITKDVVHQLTLDSQIEHSIHVKSSSSLVGKFDPVRISQIVTNLVSNAIKYGNGNPINVEITSTLNEVKITVKDQGIGILKENQAKIFNRFERVTEDENISGLGLGLYITKQIVETLKGKIEVESELGQGSIFHVHIPIH